MECACECAHAFNSFITLTIFAGYSYYMAYISFQKQKFQSVLQFDSFQYQIDSNFSNAHLFNKYYLFDFGWFDFGWFDSGWFDVILKPSNFLWLKCS